MAVQIGIGNFGGAIASNIYRTQDAPRYVVGREFPLPPSPLSPPFLHFPPCNTY